MFGFAGVVERLQTLESDRLGFESHLCFSLTFLLTLTVVELSSRKKEIITPAWQLCCEDYKYCLRDPQGTVGAQ